MQVVGGILGGSFVVASLIVGVRLVWLSTRTLKAPEALIGSGLLLLAVFGYPLMTVARKALALDPTTRVFLAMLAGASLAFGALLMTLFVVGVFHAGGRWARAVVTAYGVSLAGVFVWQTLSPGWWRWVTDAEGSWAAARWLFLVPISWGGAEALHYHRKLRRRLPLGMADPVVTDRFRLYGIAMLAGFAANAGTVVCQVLGIEVVGTAIGAAVVSPAGIAAVALWLAFLPPRSYLERLRQPA